MSQSNDSKQQLAHQDWEPVVFHKSRNPKGKPFPGEPTVSVAKFNAGKNKQAENNQAVLERKLEQEDAQLPTVSKTLSQTIQQARCGKKWNQKQLADACNLPPRVIQDLESGRGTPNNADVQKVSRALGVPLSIKK